MITHSHSAAPEPIPNLPRFLTLEDAADFLGGLNARTMIRWARKGYIPAIPIGEGKRRLWRFLQSDLETWMISRRNVSA